LPARQDHDPEQSGHFPLTTSCNGFHASREATGQGGHRGSDRAGRRGLITGRTGNLGIILPDLTNPFFPGIVKGVQACC
jgi:hypothetical protein